MRRLGWRIKSYCWRATAIWCWLHIISSIGFRKDVFRQVEVVAVRDLEKLLRVLDFSPGKLDFLPLILKSFWVLCISNFSAIQIFGLCVYIVVSPITLLALVLKPRLSTQYLANKEKESAKPFAVQKKNHSQTFLVSSLIVWFSLYGSSASKGPIVSALLLTGALLVVRLSKATPYTTTEEVGGGGPSTLLSRFAWRYFLNTAEQLVNKKLTVAQLNSSVKTQRWILRKLRYLSIFLRGRVGKRRASLLVLLSYIYDFGLLGALLVLFWALYIKLSLSPHSLITKDALIASASHIIPGVQEVSPVSLNKTLEILIPFSGWMMFVVFIGPVASMYPAYQDRYLKRVEADYAVIRIARRSLYRVSEAVSSDLERPQVSVEPPPASPPDSFTPP